MEVPPQGEGHDASEHGLARHSDVHVEAAVLERRGVVPAVTAQVVAEAAAVALEHLAEADRDADAVLISPIGRAA